MPAKSMTGYGAAERESARGRVRVEIRSLNHRFLEISLALPRSLHPREAELKAVVSERVRRARVDVSVSWEPKASDRYRVRIDHALLSELHRGLEEAAHHLGIPWDAGVELLTRYPEAVRIEETVSAVEEESFALIREALGTALEALDCTRAVEGAALARDVSTRIEHLQDLVAEAQRSAETEPAKIAERLRERVQALLGESKLDAERLHQEVAFLADRADVTEELVRLRTHLDRARELLRAEDELGKPFDFLLQELGREANTLGSKLRAPEAARVVLAMKSEIEKIREQARNLE